MKYYVTFKVDARYEVAVEADSIEDAKVKATSEYEAADFGEISEVIDGQPIMVGDGKDILWD